MSLFLMVVCFYHLFLLYMNQTKDCASNQFSPEIYTSFNGRFSGAFGLLKKINLSKFDSGAAC